MPKPEETRSVDQDQSTHLSRLKAAMVRHPRQFLLPAVLVLAAAIVAWAGIPRPVENSTRAPPPSIAGGPLVEGAAVERMFGLHQGLHRYQVRKMAKPYAGKVLRISGIVRDVRSPSAEMTFARLEDRGRAGADSGVSLMFRRHFEPDYGRLAPGLALRASCVFRGSVEPDRIQFEDCRFTP